MRIASLVVSMAADISALQRGFAAAVTETNRMVSRIQTGLASIGLAIGIREVGQYADSWTLAAGRIRLYTSSAGEAAQVQSDLFRIAQDTRSEFENTATLYTRLAQGSRELGLESRELLVITRAVGNALRLSNASTAESVSVMRQLSQAFSSGRFQGDELRSIVENSAVLGDIIAKSLGVTVGKLRELGAEGKVVPKQVADALLAAAAQIERDATSLPTTIAQAFTQLSNSFQRFIGETNNATGASTKLVRGINAVGRAFDENRPLIEALILTLGAAGLVGAIVALGKALAGLAITQTIASIFALGAALGPVAPLMVGIRAAAIAMWSAIMGPLGAIALLAGAFAVFLKLRKDAEDAREEVERFREEMGKLSKTDLTIWANETIARINDVQKQFDDLRRTMSEGLRRRIAPTTQQVEDLEDMRQELITLGAQLREVLALRQKAIDPVTPPSGGGKTGFDFKAFIEEGQRLLDFFDDLRDRKQSTTGLADDLLKIFETAEQKLAAIKDPLSEEAAAIRKFIAEIRQNAEAMAVIKLEKARIKFPIIPEIEVPSLARTEDNISQALTPIAALVGAQFGKAFGDTVARTLSLQSKPKLEIVTAFIPPTDADFRNLQAQIERLTTKQGLVDLAQLTGNKAFEAQAITDFQRAYDQAIVSVRNIADAIRQSNLPLAVQLALLLRLGAIAKGIPQPLNQAADRLTQFVTAGRGIVQIASQFSNLNRNILQVVGSILDAAQAMKQFNEAKKQKDTLGQISGALGVAGAAVSFGGAIGELLFGAARRAQKELERVIRENTNAIAENNLILKGFNNTFGAQGVFLSIIDRLIGPATRLIAARENFSATSTGSSRALIDAQQDFIAAINATGLTIHEMDAIAKQFNITLLDSEGRIIPQAFLQLQEQIRKTREALFKFQTTVEDVSLERRLRNAVGNVPETPEQIISDTLQDLRKLAPELFERFFDAIDFSDGLSQNELAEIRRQSKQLVEDFFSGVIGPDDLPGFETPQEFEQFVLRWLDALNSMADAANEVTKALVNVPEGFKIERARFNATDPFVNQNIIRQIPPFVPPPPTTTHGSLPTGVVPGGGTVINVSGPVTIDAKDRSMEAAFSDLQVLLKRKARAMGPNAKAADAFDN